jgi:hypothetical protein
VVFSATNENEHERVHSFILVHSHLNARTRMIICGKAFAAQPEHNWLVRESRAEHHLMLSNVSRVGCAKRTSYRPPLD